MDVHWRDKGLELCISEDSLTFVGKLVGPDELVAEKHENVTDSLNIGSEDLDVCGGLVNESVVCIYVISVRLNIQRSVVGLNRGVVDVVLEVLEINNVGVVPDLEVIVDGPYIVNAESDGLDSDHSVSSDVDSVSELLISEEDFS